jgi:hypothetical protein
VGGILLRFRLYALVKDSHLAAAFHPAACADRDSRCGNATAAEKRRAIIFFIWIVAFADGLETSQSVLIRHCESATDTHHF